MKEVFLLSLLMFNGALLEKPRRKNDKMDVQQLAAAIVTEAERAKVPIDSLIEEMKKLSIRKVKKYNYTMTLEQVLNENQIYGPLSRTTGQPGLEDHNRLLDKFKARAPMDSYEEQLLGALDIRFGRRNTRETRAYRQNKGIPMNGSGHRAERKIHEATPRPGRRY